MNAPYLSQSPLEGDSNWPLWQHCLECAAVSDIGLRRANNQDAKAVVLAGSQEDFDRRGHLFLVADGMGAHAAGELASKLAADNIPLTYTKHPARDPAAALRVAVEEANQKIHIRGQESEDFQGMGTTVSTLVLLPQGALVAHVGDSRVYRLRGTLLEQLTFDHSLAWELHRDQPKTDISPGIPKNIILRSLGPRETVEVDLEGYYPLEQGDTFLLCTDGLSGQVTNEEIAAILQCLPPSEALQVFVDIANLRGGPDNITGIVVHVTGPLQIGTGTSQGTGLKSRSAGAQEGGGLGSKLWSWIRGGSRGRNGKRWGKGPYQTLDSPPSEQVVVELQKVVQELRNAAARSQWQIDWEDFNQKESAGQQAAQSNDFPQAVQHFCRAILGMMHQLRQQRSKD